MATGILVGGAVIGAIGSKKASSAQAAAGREQERLDAENRKLYQMEVDESVRRTTDINRQTAGLASSQIGASGFGGGSSMDSYMKTLEATQEADIDWMQTSGASNIAIQEREASARARNTRAMSKATLWSGIGSSLSGLGGAFKW